MIYWLIPLSKMVLFNLLQVLDSRAMDSCGLDNYLQDMDNGAWGDGVMLSAAVRLYGRPIVIVTPHSEEQKVDAASESCAEYIKLGLINENHYVSVNEVRCAEKCDADSTEKGEVKLQGTEERAETTELSVSVEETSRKFEKPTQPAAELPEQQSSDENSTDISRIFKKSRAHQLNDNDRQAALIQRWTPSKREDMPFSVHVTAQGKQVRRYLGENFLKEYKWLAVSKEPGFEGAWCVYCTTFQSSLCGGSRGSHGGIGGNQKMGALVSTPLSKFKKLSGKDGALSNHESTQFHKASQLRAVEFLSRSSGSGAQVNDVRSVIDANRRREVEQNRAFFCSLADILITCAKQDIPIRGRRDDGMISMDGDDPPENDGNWRSLIRLTLRHGNTILAQHLHTARRNAMYTSKIVQNELLQAAGFLIKQKIVMAVAKARFFSVLADETQDRAKRELLQVTVRYVDQAADNTWVIKEDPICLIDLLSAINEQQSGGNVADGETETVDATAYDPAEERVRMTGESIGNCLIAAMKNVGLVLDNCVGCGFDGASAMSSESIGAAAFVKREAPLADYFHCTMHSFNLSVSQSSKIVDIHHCFDCIQKTVSFFRYSAKRTLCLERVVKHRAPEARRVRLAAVCSTRFIERHTAVLVFSEMMPFVVEALQGMTHWSSVDTRRTALQLLNSILTPQFIVSLVILESITALMHPVSSSLQKVGIDIIGAIQQIDNLLAVLRDWRENAETKFSELFDKSNKLANDFDIAMSCPRAARLSQYRSNIRTDNPCDFYRLNIYIPLLDLITNDIGDRFGPHQRQTYALAGLIPAQLGHWNQVKVSVDKYAEFLDTPVVVEAEFSLWSQKWANATEKAQCTTAVSALNECPSEFFPNMNILLRILSTLPSSTAEPERVFSKVNKTLSAVRSTMTEIRLEACILLQAHRDIAPKPASVVEHFARSGARRLSFVL